MPRKNQLKSLRRNLENLSAILALFIAVTACVYRSDRSAGTSLEDETPTPEITKPEISSPKNAAKNNNSPDKKSDDGDFIVEHIAVENPRYREIDRQVRQEKLIERAADKLNTNLILPHDIALRTKDCKEVNAFYDPRDHSVTVCYELMEHFYGLFKKSGKSDQAAYDKMFDAIRFAFLHELGHALIDAYKLPVIGNEEDAADRCSSYICLTQLGDEGVRSVMAAADGFAIESKETSASSRNMADEHLLQEQRFYNTLCMIYGADPKKYEYLVVDKYLPQERAVRCPGEFERTIQSWNNVFEPWRKE